MALNRDVYPKSLYKYLGADRIDVLDAASIRFSPLSAFNDPFEGRPEIAKVIPESDLQRTIDQAIETEAGRAYDALGDAMKAAMPAKDFRDLARSTMIQRLPALREMAASYLPDARAKLFELFENKVGTLTLSEVPDSLLMWAHYAGAHTGFVLEFDARHDFFHQQISSDDELRHIRRVVYRDVRPSVYLTEVHSEDLFLCKSTLWSYEREWRMLLPFQMASAILTGASHPIHLFAFPRSAITAVILGARVSAEMRARIASLLRGNPEYGHVKVKKAITDESHFILRIVEDPI